MAIIPIFIHIHEKSDKELREEWERDRRWRKMMEAEEEERKRRKREEELREFLRRMDERKKAEEEYREAERKNPWDFQILPEGWSPFGQWYFPIITEGEDHDIDGGWCD